MEDPTAALTFMMEKHTVAVTARASHDTAKNAFDTRNSKSLESIKGSQVRLAAARTDLLNQWNASVGPEATKRSLWARAKTNALISRASTSVSTSGEDNGPEKEYWLAAQSYNRIASSIAKEPAELSELRGCLRYRRRPSTMSAHADLPQRPSRARCSSLVSRTRR